MLSTFTVVNVSDSGPGSLRQAILDANATANVDGPDLIDFNIAGPGVQTISPLSVLPTITDPVVIDGYTQPGAMVNTDPNGFNGTLLIELDGTTAGSGTNGLQINAGGSTVRGLVINRFGGNGIMLDNGGFRGQPPIGGNSITGNIVGLDPTGTLDLGNLFSGVCTFNSDNNTIGGTVPAVRNVISGNGENGVALFEVGSDMNTIAGNLIGTDSTGELALGNKHGVRVDSGAGSNMIGGLQSGTGNVIAGNTFSGVVLAGHGVTLNRVAGNRIGTNTNGNQPLGNGFAGVFLGGFAGDNTIGGDDDDDGVSDGVVMARNIISANSSGVYVIGAGTGNFVRGNFIGTDVGGTLDLGNSMAGVHFEADTGSGQPFHLIGGTAAGAGNVIAFNRGAGVFVEDSTGVAILANSIFSNVRLGIDLNSSASGNGVTPNDASDSDTGANHLQNFPVLTTIGAVGSGTRIQGTLNSTPNTQFRVELFVNDTRDPSGFGEGQTFLGFIDVTTDGDGKAAVDFTAAGLIPAGRFVTATATRLAPGLPIETSEFSAALCSLIVTNTLNSGIGSLRKAITRANAMVNFDRTGDGIADPDSISFAIPGTSVHTIAPLSALPTVTNAVIIDGYTQPGTRLNDDPNGFNGTLLVQLSGVNVPNGSGITITGSNSIVRGLVINRFPSSAISISTGGSNLIEGNLLGANPVGTIAAPNAFGLFVASGNNRIGGTMTAARNLISGNTLYGIYLLGASATGNAIEGNFIGTNASGTGALGNGLSGIRLDLSTDNTVGGIAAGARNVISGNGANGVDFFTNSNNNRLQGNYIGLDVTGTVALGNRQVGVEVFSSEDNAVGGTIAAARNVISANASSGISLTSASSNTVQGNYIGTDVSGTLPLGNGINGVDIASSSFDNAIGGVEAGTGNRIAFNRGNGVNVRIGIGNSILSNSILTNERLGIDLGDDGVTPNDAGDGDAGPNQRQNYPVISSISAIGNNTRIQGTLNSAPNAQYRIELFANDAHDTSGFGEGHTFLGFVDAITDASGNATIDFTTPGLVPAVAATATDPDGNTSEFSPVAGSLIVTHTQDDGLLGSLREAIKFANAKPGLDTIMLPPGVYNLTIGGVREDHAQTGDLDITDDLIIIGAGADDTIIDGQELDRVLQVVGERFSEPPRVTLTMSGVTIRNGRAMDGDGGGGILNQGNLTLGQSTVTSNHSLFGGGVSHPFDGALKVIESTIDQNEAGDFGGGIWMSSTFGSTLEVIDSTISNNTADAHGGGIYLVNRLDATIRNSTISENIAGLSGGGIMSDSQQARITLSYVTIAKNVADFVRTGFSWGGGIRSGGILSMGASIIADNIDHSGIAPDAGGTIESRGYNLIEDTKGATISGDATGNILGQDPRLGPLADNGGSTLTHALLEGSPALNTVDTVAPAPPDQRGVPRPQGPAPDMGAFESTEFSEVLVRIDDVSVEEGDDGTRLAVFTVTLSAPTAASPRIAFSTAHGSAGDADYQPVSGTLTFAPLEVTKTITVQVHGDLTPEPDETFLINLAIPADFTADDVQGLGIIQDDDDVYFVVGADAGAGPHVRTLDGSGQEQLSFYAFDPGFTGGVRVTTGDVTGDGTPDIITAAGPGGGPHVRVFDGTTGEQVPGAIGSFYAYNPAFSGGVFVAAADFDGDGLADIVTGADAGGGPHIRVFSGRDGSELAGFFDFTKGVSGVRVATGDIDGDGTPDIIAAAGPGSAGSSGILGNVRVFSGLMGRAIEGGAGLLFPYPGFRGGIYVASGDVNGDGRNDVITGAGAGGGPHVRAFSGVDGSEIASFYAYDPNFSGGVRVGAGDVDQDGDLEIITGAGPGAGPHVMAFDLVDDGTVASFYGFNPAFTGGVFVAGAAFGGSAAGASAAIVEQPAEVALLLDDGTTPGSEVAALPSETKVQELVLVDDEREAIDDGAFTDSDETIDWSSDEALQLAPADRVEAAAFSWPALVDLVYGVA